MSTAPLRRAARAALPFAVFALVLAAAPARAGRAESGPRLSLPGGFEVTPGQVVDLRWSDADDVRELEILLSTDGGMSDAICISPQLDPHAHGFRWRVPDLPGGRWSLRIRYNRGGREIEGAPIRLAANGDRDLPVPLGLPSRSAEKPASGGRSGETARGNASLTESSEPEALAPPVTGRTMHEATTSHRDLTPSAWIPVPRIPRFLPLRI